jgi:hypothetical protein
VNEKWKLQIGVHGPSWLADAIRLGLVEPVRDEGPNRWAQHGLRIVKTGVVVPLGTDLYRDALPL